MSKISIAEALKLVDVSKTTLYRDLKENKLSSTTDAKGKKVIDTAELERFYGQLKSPSMNGAGNNGNSQSDPTEHNGTDGNPASDEVPESAIGDPIAAKPRTDSYWHYSVLSPPSYSHRGNAPCLFGGPCARMSKAPCEKGSARKWFCNASVHSEPQSQHPVATVPSPP